MKFEINGEFILNYEDGLKLAKLLGKADTENGNRWFSED